MSGTQHLDERLNKTLLNLKVKGVKNVSGVNTYNGVIIVAEAGSETSVMEEIEKNFIDDGVMDVDTGNV